MDISVLLKLIESYAVLLIPLIVGITEVIKRILPEGYRSQWAPVIAICCGIGLSFLLAGISGQSFLIGVIIGLSASGLWSGAKHTITRTGGTFGILLIFILFTGCATSQTGLATKSLLTMKETIVSIAQAADELCTKGLLTQKECDKVKDIYEKSQVSYDAAADMLIIAIHASDIKANWEAYQELFNKFIQLYQDMYNVAIEFRLIPTIEGGGK